MADDILAKWSTNSVTIISNPQQQYFETPMLIITNQMVKMVLLWSLSLLIHY